MGSNKKNFVLNSNAAAGFVASTEKKKLDEYKTL